jgi:hypothetical protein
MHLHERLMDLLGHEVSITAQADGDVRQVVTGTVKEVGPDFIIVGTVSRETTGQNHAGVDWWMRLAMVVAIVHATDCPKCVSPDPQPD